MNLRRGYTTGACAQAAAAAAAEVLAGGNGRRETRTGDAIGTGDATGIVEVTLPNGEAASFRYRADSSPPEAETNVISATERGPGTWCVTAWVTKDGGDDPDVTDGLRVGAEVCSANAVFSVEAGEGVGTVTLPGLAVEPGRPAVNPVPRDAVLHEVRRRLPRGATVRLHVPGGEEAARKTLNPRLGVVGGISILGTTGRVEPWSVEAMRDSLVPQLDVAAARRRRELVFVLGAKGHHLAVQAGFEEPDVVEVANEIGWMLERAVERGFARVTVRGHVGKLAKLAAGIFDTHSRTADARLVTLAAYAGAVGVDPENVRWILTQTTAEAGAAHLVGLGRTDALLELARAGARACAERYGIPVRLVVLAREGNILADSGFAEASASRSTEGTGTGVDTQEGS